MVDLYHTMLKIIPKSINETMKKDVTKLEWCSGLLYAKNPWHSCWTMLAHRWFDGGCLYYASTSMSALSRTFSGCCCFARPCVHKQELYTSVKELLTGRGWSEAQSEWFAECQQNRTTVILLSGTVYSVRTPTVPIYYPYHTSRLKSSTPLSGVSTTH